MDKEHLISEIRRSAEANGGVALGWRCFEEEAGIKYDDGYGQFWTRWSDAVCEANAGNDDVANLWRQIY